MSDFKAKCAKFDFRWGYAPVSTRDWGAYSALPDALIVFTELTSRGRGREGEGRKGR